MASYYYLMSSLPMLKADGDMPFSYSDFLDACRSSVSEQKYLMLESLDLSSNTGPLVSDWHKFYGVLQKEMAYQRNSRLGRPASVPYEREEKTTRAVTAAMNEKNPLEAEKMLLAFEFEKLDDLISTHYFDDCALMGYAIKLKLLERKSAFNKKDGKDELTRILGGLEQEVMRVE